MPMDPSASRLDVAKHGTVIDGLYALLRSFSAHIRDGTSGALADSIDARPREWVDAVFANTPEAMMTAGAQIPPGDLPHITDTTDSNIRPADRAPTAEEHPPVDAGPTPAEMMTSGTVDAPKPINEGDPVVLRHEPPNAPPHGE